MSSRAEGVLRHPVFQFVIAGCALALFSWPILRTPPPDAEFAYLFLFVAWAFIILVFFLMTRSAGPRAPEHDRPWEYYA
jgi:hypothetical protein